ncbi:MAG TPA: DHA2 family efflux MFS transporter permease subunit [Steroidobacteraceae bacterium]|nr:DHA2 family efflux MFS transporter permease subunit [Steroidobacteraceae bacterium]
MSAGTPRHRGLITASVTLATILQAVDTTIANVALPHIGGNLSASLEQMDWVLTSYIVAAAIMTPLSGWLAGRFGRKRVLVGSVIGFTVSSMLCGMAQSIDQIVFFRVLQGLSGAGLVPLSQAVLLDINPPERHGRAMALWGQGVVLGPMLAPVLGGWLTDNYSWRWVFYINVPFGVLSAIGLMAYVRETDTRKSRFDFLGFGALSLAVGALQIFLDRGELRDWFGSPEIWIEAGIAIAAFYVFIVHTLTAREPFVSLALFRDTNFSMGNLLVFVVGVVLFATLALLPPLLQDLLGYPVLTSGIAMAPRGFGSFVSMYVAGRLIGRVDSRLLIGIGIAVTAASLEMMCGYSTLMPQTLVWSTTFLQGLGTGLTYVTLTTVAFATLGVQYRSEGTSMFNLLRNVGSSIGIAATGALLTRNTQVMHERLAAHIIPWGGQIRLPAPFSLSAPAGLAALNAAVTRQAQMIAYNDDFKLMFWMTLALIPLVLLLRPARARPQSPAVME